MSLIDAGISLIATFFGAFLGFIGGLWLQRREEARNTDKKTKHDKKRREQLIATMRDSLKTNLEKVEQLRGDFDQNHDSWAPSYNVDLTVLEATAHMKFQIMNDFNVSKNIDVARYELGHLWRKVELLSEAWVNPGAGSHQFNIIRTNITGHLHIADYSIKKHSIICRQMILKMNASRLQAGLLYVAHGFSRGR